MFLSFLNVKLQVTLKSFLNVTLQVTLKSFLNVTLQVTLMSFLNVKLQVTLMSFLNVELQVTLMSFLNVQLQVTLCHYVLYTAFTIAYFLEHIISKPSPEKGPTPLRLHSFTFKFVIRLVINIHNEFTNSNIIACTNLLCMIPIGPVVFNLAFLLVKSTREWGFSDKTSHGVSVGHLAVILKTGTFRPHRKMVGKFHYILVRVYCDVRLY